MLGLARLVTGAGGGHGPSLNFNFVDGSAFSPQITFTRASSATYFNSSGVLTSAGNDEPRFDYDPATLAARGFLIEEQRTNSIRNNTMVGAVAGTPGTLPTNWVSTTAGGLTREIVGTGTTNGITYIDFRYTGTPSATSAMAVNFEANTGVAALQNQIWTTSAWAAIVGGTLTNITLFGFGYVERDSGGASVAAGLGSAFTPTSTLTRQSYTRTLSAATTAFYQPSLRFGFVDTVTPVDFTLRIGLPQLELGAFATSVIPTTTTALTRSADVASVNTLSPWFNATEGTLYSEWSVPAIGGAGGRRAGQFDDGTGNNEIRFSIYRPHIDGLVSASIVDGGVTQSDQLPSGSVVAANAVIKTAQAFQTNLVDFARAGTLATQDTSATVPSVSILRLGSGQAALWLSGHLRRITYYPRKLSPAELQAITA